MEGELGAGELEWPQGLGEWSTMSISFRTVDY